MNWSDVVAVVGKLAPTVATALGGPLAGEAVAALGSILGISEPTRDKIATAIENGALTGQQVADLRSLEMKYQDNERERGFRYAELEYKDRDSARRANVEGHTQMPLFWLSVLLLLVTLGSEIAVLFRGYPNEIPDIIVGRVLGLLDAVAMMVLAYWYGTTNGSQIKSTLLANSAPVTKP
jgi:hypothetical protein